MYADFDTSKIRPGEPVAILGNDPSVPSGKALYIAFAANDVRRLCSIEDISEMVNAGEFVGPQGPKGEKGDKGDPGEKGADGTVAFESLTPEQKESLRGISIKSASVDTDGNLTIMFSDGDSEDVGNIMGPQGIQGPKGDKGDVGPQGLKGDKGDVGPKGDNMSDEQAAQIEQNKTDIASLKTETGSLKEDISNKITKFYASSQGESHLADSDNGKIMDMMVYGKSEQKQYSGKNLLNPTFETDTYSGVALTNNGDGTYTIEGTNNSSGELIFSLVRTVDEQKALYNSLIGKNVKFIVESGSTISGSVGRICFVFYNKTENRFSNETYNGGNVTVPTGYDSSVIDIHINVGQTVPKTILKPMIVDASLYPDATYDTFEPYTGGIPSPNPDYPQEIKSVVKPRVKVCGKNLLNTTLQTTTQSGVTFTANGDGTYTLNGIAKALIDVSLSKNFHIENGKMYRITGWVKNVSGSIYLVNGKDSAGDTGDGVTFTYIDATNDSKVIRIQIPKGAIINNVIIKPMICTDASATYDDFEPYHEQTVTLPYDLYGVKVPSGGNVTIDGQEYVSDYFDVERGKLVRMVDDVEAKNYTWNLYPNGNNMPRRFGMNDTIRFNMPADIRIMSSHFKQIAANTRTDLSTWFQTYYIAITDMNEKWKNSEALIQWFSENKVHFYLPLKTPTEIDLTSEEVQALKALTAYYPTTNISVNSEQLDGYTVFNYPISMENGWNYVKQQIGDTRDYIYDMDARTQDTDLQAAEAYVNSEYAVTLTELEV
jgi:hypothetical protein